MSHRVVLVLSVIVLAAGVQPGSDKRSPVPRRPVRPSFVSPSSDQSRRPSPRNTVAERENTGREPQSERSRTAAASGQKTGTACFFSSGANGGVTGSGSRFNSEEFQAAHPTFPLGSWVRVTNLANGQTADVLIVDRFPGGSGRIINVSEAAARRLRFVKAGTARVELELIAENPGTSSPE